MSTRGYGIIDELYQMTGGGDNYAHSLTLGTVVDTNDPQQMGRIRVVCPALGDSFERAQENLPDIPWALYMSPFGGTTVDLARGPGDNVTPSGVSYGMWNIPKVGAQVIVFCIDGNPMLRVWIGCLYGQFQPHTMPHGRYIQNYEGGVPDGPLSHEEEAIQPLYDNLTEAFDGRTSYEWKTRGADYSAAAIDSAVLVQVPPLSFEADDKDVTDSGFNVRQGYAESRLDTNTASELTGGNFDSQVYSWTSPGFHAISMDDRIENSRMRFRSSTGHQIILDDTNERIYVSTSKGKNWIEMDQVGNIDMYSERRVSIRAAKDINFTTDDTFRIHAASGIHMYTASGDIRMQTANGNAEMKFSGHCNLDIGDAFDVNTSAAVKLTSGDAINFNSSAALNLQSGADTNINAGGQFIATGSAIHLNGPPAASADSAGNAEDTFWTNRVPDHEPWPRVIIGNPSQNTDHSPEYSINDANVNKVEDGEDLSRGQYWRR